MRAFLRSRFVALTGLLVLFTGCITIEENYTFKKNGAGTMEYVVDMSQIGEMMKAFEDLDKGGKKDKDVMGAMDLTDQVAKLKQLPGIKKVKVKGKEFVQRLTFEFADVKALNGALNVLMADSTGNSAGYDFFAWEGNTLVRHNNGHARSIAEGMGKGEESASDTTDMTQFLSSMKYKYSFAFADPIGTTAAADGVAQESPDARTVKFDTDFGVISKDEKALDLRIELKK